MCPHTYGLTYAHIQYVSRYMQTYVLTYTQTRIHVKKKKHFKNNGDGCIGGDVPQWEETIHP